MAQKNWDKIEEIEFARLPQDYQEDWGELRDVTNSGR